jgi:hypothetical protein
MPRDTSAYDPKVLIVGAGTIGSVYGARMARADVDMTILDQGARLEQIKRDGLAIEDAATRRRLRADVAIIDDLVGGAGYDLAIVPVRKTQAAAALARVAEASLVATANSQRSLACSVCFLASLDLAEGLEVTASSATASHHACCRRPRLGS